MVHTASLILDDLPSMDDAIVRRGRPVLGDLVEIPAGTIGKRHRRNSRGTA